MLTTLFALTSSLNGILDFVVPLYFVSSLFAVYEYHKAVSKSQKDSEARYALPKVDKNPKEKKTWKQQMVGHWAVTDAQNMEGWLSFNKLSAVKRMIFPTVFFRIKHDIEVYPDFFQFSRYMKYPDDPNLVAKMKLYSSEDEALAHIDDCQQLDAGENVMKSFSTFVNEEEKSFTTLIAPTDTSGNTLRITHVRKMVDENTLSVMWKSAYYEQGRLQGHVQEMATTMERLFD